MGDTSLRRRFEWYRSRAQIARLEISNRARNRSVTGNAAVAVSMTTHGSRLQTVHTAIQSIVSGRVRPKRFVLWLNRDPLSQTLTPQLKRLQKRGLEVRYVANFGPHTKYFPYVNQFCSDELPMVIADDDVIYSSNWLADLLAAHRLAPQLVHCHLAREIAFDAGNLAPYVRWTYAASTNPSFRHFALGFAGVIYPAPFLQVLRASGDDFMSKCPNADDVWLHVCAVRNGYRIKQLRDTPAYPRPLPFTEDIALFNTNQLATGNDMQISATYTKWDIECIASAL